MDRSDLNWFEVSSLVGTKIKDCVRHHSSRLESPSDNKANSCNLVDSVDVELDWIAWLLEET